MSLDNEDLKIRIGIGMGAWPFPDISTGAILDMIERWEELDIDSLWLSDHITSVDNILEPVVFMSFVASRMRNMLLGTSVLVLPVRNPVVLAKQLATLDLLSGGRLLPAVGLGPAISGDFAATGVPKEQRGRRTDESIRLMRRLWTEDNVTFQGEFYSMSNVTLTPKPHRPEGPPLWIGGRSDAALRRVGRVGDGWLVSGATVKDVTEGVKSIRQVRRRGGQARPRRPLRRLSALPVRRRSGRRVRTGGAPPASPRRCSGFGVLRRRFGRADSHQDPGVYRRWGYQVCDASGMLRRGVAPGRWSCWLER